jgi:hypothetical protein
VVDPWDEWDDVLGGLDPDTTDPKLFQAAVDREMTLQIGLAVRCHVRLDQTLHLTAATLTGTTMPPATPTSRLIARIEDAITKAPLAGPTANEKALEALSAARLANQHRNRVLHDDWMAVFDDDGPRLERIRTDVPGVENVGVNIAPAPDTLSSIAAVSSELTAVYYRIFGIFLFARLSNGLTPSEVETECETALSLICGVHT